MPTLIGGGGSDPNAVHITGDETISGTKTFNSSPIVPTPVNGTDAVTKDYTDSQDYNISFLMMGA
jgi:hypothetical protein